MFFYDKGQIHTEYPLNNYFRDTYSIEQLSDTWRARVVTPNNRPPHPPVLYFNTSFIHEHSIQ